MDSEHHKTANIILLPSQHLGFNLVTYKVIMAWSSYRIRHNLATRHPQRPHRYDNYTAADAYR